MAIGAKTDPKIGKNATNHTFFIRPVASVYNNILVYNSRINGINY